MQSLSQSSSVGEGGQSEASSNVSFVSPPKGMLSTPGGAFVRRLSAVENELKLCKAKYSLLEGRYSHLESWKLAMETWLHEYFDVKIVVPDTVNGISSGFVATTVNDESGCDDQNSSSLLIKCEAIEEDKSATSIKVASVVCVASDNEKQKEKEVKSKEIEPEVESKEAETEVEIEKNINREENDSLSGTSAVSPMSSQTVVALTPTKKLKIFKQLSSTPQLLNGSSGIHKQLSSAPQMLNGSSQAAPKVKAARLGQPSISLDRCDKEIVDCSQETVQIGTPPAYLREDAVTNSAVTVGSSLQNDGALQEDEISVVYESRSPAKKTFPVSTIVPKTKTAKPTTMKNSPASQRVDVFIPKSLFQTPVTAPTPPKVPSIRNKVSPAPPNVPAIHNRVSPAISDANFVPINVAVDLDQFEIETDDPTPCSVCGTISPAPHNEMIFCDKCGLCVHQVCYGVRQIPLGGWQCNPCAAGLTTKELPCYFCPMVGGALKPVKSPARKHWAHVSCAIWIPEVNPENMMTMEPIININMIPKNRWKLKCSLCKTPQGACIQCQFNKRCAVAFHVTCAMKHGLDMKEIVGDTGNELKAFCKNHTYVAKKKTKEPESAKSNQNGNTKTKKKRSNDTTKRVQSPKKDKKSEKVRSPKKVSDRELERAQSSKKVRGLERVGSKIERSPKKDQDSERVRSPKKDRDSERSRSPKKDRDLERARSPKKDRENNGSQPKKRPASTQDYSGSPKKKRTERSGSQSPIRSTFN